MARLFFLGYTPYFVRGCSPLPAGAHPIEMAFNMRHHNGNQMESIRKERGEFFVKRLAIFAIVAVLSLGLLTACGGGGGGAPVTLDVVAGENGEWKFSPSTFEVAKGSEVTINLVNKDKVKHDFVISDLNVKVVAEAGGTGTGKFKASKEGTFNVICAEPGHKDAGMTGTLTVK